MLTYIYILISQNVSHQNYKWFFFNIKCDGLLYWINNIWRSKLWLELLEYHPSYNTKMTIKIRSSTSFSWLQCPILYSKFFFYEKKMLTKHCARFAEQNSQSFFNSWSVSIVKIFSKFLQHRHLRMFCFFVFLLLIYIIINK